jgi:RES domain-containing protein
VNVGGELTEEFPAPFDPARMKPLTDRSREGRANPSGIPYLYLATHQQTAAAEVRPWIGSYVSIATFNLMRDARVVNCTTGDHKIIAYLREPEPQEREQAVWRDIDRAFSEPVTSDDDSAAYSPTQVVAEFFRDNDIDGIAYGSSLGPGHNVVLFDPGAAALENCGLVKVRTVTLDLSPEGNSYFVTKHVPETGTRTPEPGAEHATAHTVPRASSP